MLRGNTAKVIAIVLILSQLFALPLSASAQSLNLSEIQKMLAGGAGGSSPLKSSNISGADANSQLGAQQRFALQDTNATQSAAPQPPSSTIEKAYRLQYTAILLDQFKHIEEFQFLESKYDSPWGQDDNKLPFDELQAQDAKDERLAKFKAYVKSHPDLYMPQTLSGNPDDPETPPTPEYNPDKMKKDKVTAEDYDDIRMDLLSTPSKTDALSAVTAGAGQSDTTQEKIKNDKLHQELLEKYKEARRLVRQKQLASRIINEQLVQFGYDFFNPRAVNHQDALAPSPGYILGPGDEVQTSIWGSNTGQEDISGKVAQDGTLNLPGIGVIPVSGVRYGDLTNVLQQQVNKVTQGVNLNVRLTRLRSFQVYVTGQVAQPGLKTVPAFASVVTALSVAAGPLKSGSLRNVQVLRQGKVIRTVDLYSLMINGQSQDDILLEDKDVINVPYIGPTAAVVGAVVRPGIFEIKGPAADDTVLNRLLSLAGEPLGQAFHKAYLRHFEQHGAPNVNDVEIDPAKNQSTRVANGDLVEVRFVGATMTQAVKLRGCVFERLEKTYTPGIKLSALISSPTLLKPGAVTDFGVIRRYTPLTASFTTLRFPLDKVLKGEYDMELAPYDQVFILDKKDYGTPEKVYIAGAVKKPGGFDYEPGMNLQSLLAMAGGLKFGANANIIELNRQYVVSDTIQTKRRTLTMEEAAGVTLQPFDSITVPILNNAGKVRQIELKGRFLFPGIYTIRDGERLSDVIARAGGFLPDAYFYGAKYLSREAKKQQQQNLDRLARELEMEANKASIEQAKLASTPEEVKAAQAGAMSFVSMVKDLKAEGRVTVVMSNLATFKGSVYDLALDDGDVLDVPAKPSFVSVMGSVYFPNSYVYEPNLTVKDYLAKSGGPSKSADEDFIYVLKANGEVISKAQRSSFFGSDFMSSRLMPGDTLVVPEDFERVPFMRMFRDVATIFFQLATTAGVAIAAINTSKN